MVPASFGPQSSRPRSTPRAHESLVGRRDDPGYGDLEDATSGGRKRERRRQEWRFAEEGRYAKHFDGRTTRANMQPNAGNEYTYTVIENKPGDLYFTASKSGPKGDVVESGDYRRHFHDVIRQTYQNLDFFPASELPTLWRLVKAGRGFKAFPRRVPRIADVDFPTP